MGKYFKEEETSNRIKRFKTSDFQEKSSRFAQLSKVIGPIDKFKDFIKIVFPQWRKTSKLIKVDTGLLVKLENEFDSVIEAQKIIAAKHFTDIKKLRDEIIALDYKRLKTGLDNDKLRKDLSNEIAAKQEEISKLEKEFVNKEIDAKDSIQTVVDEYNRTNSPITSTLRWNQDLKNPKMDWIIGMPLSLRGTNIALPRISSEIPLGFNQLISSLSRSGRVNLAAKRKLDKIGFDDVKKGYEFVDLTTNVTVKKSLYQIIEALSTNNFEAKLVLKNEDEKIRLEQDTQKFISILEESEKGAQNNPALRILYPLVKKIGLVGLVSGVVGGYAVFNQQSESKNPRSVEERMKAGKDVLSTPPPNAPPARSYEQELLELQNRSFKSPLIKERVLRALKTRYGK